VRNLFDMWTFILIGLTFSFVLSVPLDGSESNFNSNPFIILAQSAESADLVQSDFSTETVQIVTSASVKKGSKDGTSDSKNNNEPKVQTEEAVVKKTEQLVNNPVILDTSHWKILSSFNLSSSRVSHCKRVLLSCY
jgi:hypothetical protein